ncbi:hypothetical protein F2P56_030439, partial [Juglans regia]
IVFQEVAESVKKDFGSIDILVHSLANGPEVSKPLLETSRKGYLAAISASSYSYVSLLKHFVPIMNPGGSSISLTYIASERIIPGYGGGMSLQKLLWKVTQKCLLLKRAENIKSESTQYLLVPWSTTCQQIFCLFHTLDRAMVKVPTLLMTCPKLLL